ncbi:dolichyl-diphosphooligosaccharide--protein glycosyltransferase subunit DAD1-like [Cetorhinus maximus]
MSGLQQPRIRPDGLARGPGGFADVGVGVRVIVFPRLGLPVMMRGSVLSVLSRFSQEYAAGTPLRLKLLDSYLLYMALSGVAQFLYCALVGTFPFNSFLSGFIACVGAFVLAVCLRIQINPQNKGDFIGISPERAFADFLFASTILHLVVINFIG